MRKNYLILPVMMVAGTFLISGCNDIESAYNQDYIQEQAKKVFPVKNVDSNHTWAMNSLCSASVSVDETSGESYTIKVYTANPYNINSDALLLAKETVANGQTVNFKFDIPNALQYVYVVKVNAKGYSSMKPVAVTDGKIEAAFGGADAVANAAKTRAVSSIVHFDAPDVNNTDLFPTKESIQQLNLSQTNGQIGQAGNYEINSSVENINCWGTNVKMYVTENVTLRSLYIAGNSKLYILPGASLIIEPEYSLGQYGSIISVGVDATLVVNGTRL